jgi:hypothetical protein
MFYSWKINPTGIFHKKCSLNYNWALKSKNNLRYGMEQILLNNYNSKVYEKI